MSSTLKAIAALAVVAVLVGGYLHYDRLVKQVSTLTVERDVEKARADQNAASFAKAEADRKVAVATLEFLQDGLIENERQARIAAEETASIPESEDAPAAAFWEKARQRMLGGGK